jgi:Mg2+ and Co2+ transporter CorA
MADIHERIDEYNREILATMAMLHSLLPTVELKQHLLYIAKLMGDRDNAFNAFAKTTMSGVQQHAENIHSFIKYIQFDLEATRRERDKYLRQLNGDQNDAGG